MAASRNAWTVSLFYRSSKRWSSLVTTDDHEIATKPKLSNVKTYIWLIFFLVPKSPTYAVRPIGVARKSSGYLHSLGRICCSLFLFFFLFWKHGTISLPRKKKKINWPLVSSLQSEQKRKATPAWLMKREATKTSEFTSEANKTKNNPKN